MKNYMNNIPTQVKAFSLIWGSNPSQKNTIMISMTATAVTVPYLRETTLPHLAYVFVILDWYLEK